MCAVVSLSAAPDRAADRDLKRALALTPPADDRRPLVWPERLRRWPPRPPSLAPQRRTPALVHVPSDKWLMSRGERCDKRLSKAQEGCESESKSKEGRLCVCVCVCVCVFLFLLSSPHRFDAAACKRYGRTSLSLISRRLWESGDAASDNTDWIQSSGKCDCSHGNLGDNDPPILVFPEVSEPRTKRVFVTRKIGTLE